MKFLVASCDPREGKRLFVILWLMLAWTAPAAPVKLDTLGVCGCNYRNVTVLTFNTTHVFFAHDGGISCMKLKFLDPKLQERFDYDPVVAAYDEKQQAADDARYQESIVSNLVAQARQAALTARRAAASSEDSLADPISDNSLKGKPAPAMKGDK